MEGNQQSGLVATLAMRERHREWYLRARDPVGEDRMLWRAQAFRHLVHLLPGQTILELGCGGGTFTRQLVRVTRGENAITALTFGTDGPTASPWPPSVTHVTADALPGPLAGRRFDFIVGMDLLDRHHCAEVLQHVHELLEPGGQVVFYQSNPWNPVLQARRLAGRLFGARDPRHLLNRSRLYELMSEVGFIRVFAVFNDFVYAPLTPRSWLDAAQRVGRPRKRARGAQLAGSILVHAQRPPRVRAQRRVSLCEHASLRGAVSVVIPCHNEEMNVGPFVTRIRELFDDYLHEIILVDDNSRDRTRDVIMALAAADQRVKAVIRTPPNGVGRALADGYRVATGRYVLSMDCDFQHLLAEVRDLFDEAAAGHDVVVGSRFSRHSVLLNYPFTKIVANRAFHVIARLLLRRHFRDLTNNLKLMRRDVVEQLRLQEPGFAVNAETGLQPLLLGYRVKEVPISWINRTSDMGASSFRLLRVGGGYWRYSGAPGVWASTRDMLLACHVVVSPLFPLDEATVVTRRAGSMAGRGRGRGRHRASGGGDRSAGTLGRRGVLTRIGHRPQPRAPCCRG